MTTNDSSKSQLEQTHFNDVHPTPPSLRVSKNNKRKFWWKKKKKKKIKILLHPNKRVFLGGKFDQLLKIFTPIPFKPLDLSLFSATQVNLLKRAGLWDFLNLKFDPELRSDLIAELIVGYNPQAAPHRRSFVNGRPVRLTRCEMGRALELPLKRKAAEKEEEGERFCGFEVISDEEVLFLENAVLKSVVLCSGEDGMDDHVLEVIRFMKEERRPELVDWRELIWVMVEKELGKGVELRECNYASHLEWFLRKQRPILFVKEVGKLGFDDLGIQKLGLGISPGVDEKESEKKVKTLVVYQRRKHKSGKMVCSEGENQKGEKGSGGNEAKLGGALGGSIFGHAEGKNEENMEVGNFCGNPNEFVVGDLWEEGGVSVGRKNSVGVDSGEEVIKDELSSIQDGNVLVLVGECLMNESDDRGREEQKDNMCLITGEGKEDESKVDFSEKGENTELGGYNDICAMELGEEKSELLLQRGEEDSMADVNMEGSNDDVVKYMEAELPDCLTEQGKDDQLKLDVLVEEEDSISVEIKSVNRDLETGKGSDVHMIVVSEKEIQEQNLGLCLLPGEMKMDVSIKEREDVIMSNADDDNGKQMEIAQVNISLEHENFVLENQEKSLLLRKGEKAEVVVKEDFVKQDGAAIDVELTSFGNSLGNQLDSTKIDLCTRQELFKHCSPSMDAEYEFQSEKDVEVREEDNADIKDMEDLDIGSLFRHYSLSTGAGSDFILEKAVEISDEESPPHGIVNDCSVVEPFVSGTSMMDQDFFGNASNRKNGYENDVFVEPFVLDQDINANMSGSSAFENPLKTEIDHLNDGQKRLKTEGLSEKKPMTNIDMSGVSMFPLKRKMNFTHDGHGIMRSGGQSNKDLSDFSSWGEEVDFWLGQTKMVVAAKEEAWLNATQEEQMLSKKLEQQDNMICLLEKTMHEELQQRNSKINCLENELFFMANQIDHYKNALETTRQTFAEFRKRCKLPEEPLYVDIPESGGIVLSSNEWEEERWRREQEERNSRLDTMVTTFQLHWFDQFEGHNKKMKTLGDRLSDVEDDMKDLKNNFQNRIFGE